MAQPVSTQNFLIHDASGKPQVIKVVHTSGGSSQVWRPGQGNQNAALRASPGGIMKTSSGAIKHRFADDDSDSASGGGGGGGYVIRRPKTEPSTVNQPTYKVVRRPSDMQQVYSMQSSKMNDSIHASNESQRLSSGNRRPGVRTSPSQMKRLSPEPDDLQMGSSPFSGKRRRSDKGGKGLRHFSMKVCQKVQKKGRTTYNEVADELVTEFTGCAFQPNVDQNFDQKNIRRRVYDALNVLMAMNIISKEKKEIRWLGLPTGYPKLKPIGQNQQIEERRALERIARKKQTLQQIILQQVALKNLMERNKAYEELKEKPALGSTIQLPLLVVNTHQNTTVNCSVSNDRREYFFNFNDVFEIKDEGHVLQEMGMMMGLNTGEATPENLIRAKTMIPRALAPYLEELVHSNVHAGPSGSQDAAERDDDEDEGTVYLDEDGSATDDDYEMH